MTGVWEPNRPELDTVPPWELDRPAVTYIVCATPRTGSGLLLRGMAATGLCGAPAEYFHVQQREALSARWRTGASPVAYAAGLRRHRTSPAGVLGMKLHPRELRELLAELAAESPSRASTPDGGLLDLFPDPRFVRIRRNDLDRQTISLWRAMNTQIWVVRAGEAPRDAPVPPYDFEQLEVWRGNILRMRRFWAEFFERNAIEPIEVVYEDLVDAYASTIVAVVERVTGTRPARPIPPPESVSQSDERTEELVARYRRDRAARLGSLSA